VTAKTFKILIEGLECYACPLKEHGITDFNKRQSYSIAINGKKRNTR
jgi:hypothetical protein